MILQLAEAEIRHDQFSYLISVNPHIVEFRCFSSLQLLWETHTHLYFPEFYLFVVNLVYTNTPWLWYKQWNATLDI